MSTTPYIPIYKRPPNKFLRFESRRFEPRTGRLGPSATLVVAIFLDKKGRQREETTRVIWDE